MPAQVKSLGKRVSPFDEALCPSEFSGFTKKELESETPLPTIHLTFFDGMRKYVTSCFFKRSQTGRRPKAIAA